MLDVLNEISESIQKRMNTKIKQSSIGRVSELTYYDVTRACSHYRSSPVFRRISRHTALAILEIPPVFLRITALS